MDDESVKNGPWNNYRNISLSEAENIIKSNLNGCARNFVAIGFYLKDIRDNETYRKGGYESIWDFAQDILQMAKSTVSRFMAINDRFSVDGNTPVLMDKYLEYGSGKLQEMLTMTDEEMENINPETTVKEIREIKKSRCDAQQKPLSEKEYRLCKFGGGKCNLWIEPNACSGKAVCESNFIRDAGTAMQEQPEKKKPDIPTFEQNGEAYGYTRNTIIESLVQEMVEMDLGIEDIDGIHCYALGFDYYAYNMETGYITIENEDEEPVFSTSVERFQGEYEWHMARLVFLPREESEEEDPVSVSDNQIKADEITERACINCKYNIMPREDYFKEYLDTNEFPCDNCNGDLNNWRPDTCIVNQEVDSAAEQENEIVEAEIIDSVQDPEGYGLSDVELEIRTHTYNLATMRKENMISPARFKTKMRLDAATALQDKLREPVAEEIPEVIQPDLPILKNNDQRKDFIDNYISWPVWINQELTGEMYYRYDFEDGTSFVIRVSLQHAYKGYERTAEIKHGHEEYFLLGVKNRWIPGMPTFTESSTNKSAMIDHLKEIQKKGAKA